MGLRGGYQEDENALLGTIYFTIKVKNPKNHQKITFQSCGTFLATLYHQTQQIQKTKTRKK